MINACYFLLVLGISVLPKRVSGHSTIPSENVQVAIVSKQQLPSVVVGRRLIDLQDDSSGRTWNIKCPLL